jgi:hypothetical protein
MNRPATVVLLALLLAPGASAGGADTLYVRTEAALARAVLAPGEKVDIRFRFTPADDIHVNADPPVAVRLDSSAAWRMEGAPLAAVDARTGFLDTSLPVRQPLALARSAPRGETTLKGEVIFYYCSDTEGWCRRAVAPFALAVRVDPTAGLTRKPGH